MSISVVIPVLVTRHEQSIMTRTLIYECREKTDLDFELVIVETESDHFSKSADVYIHEKMKTNATKSINRGFRCCSGEKIVLLTNDVKLKDGWLECLLDCFKIEDCGLSTLATTQLGHCQEDKIAEGVWFSVAMFNRQPGYEYFDEGYVNSWDDTDFIMRHYLKGKKMYRNHNCVVDHDPGQTQYEKSDHQMNFLKNRALFMKKYSDCGHKMYEKFISGEII